MAQAHGEFGDPGPLWSEASAIVRSQQDAEVHEEALGLLVAEMASVTLADRLAVLVAGSRGSTLRVRLRDGTVVDGRVESAAGDHVVICGPTTRVLVPLHSIAVICGLPRALHVEETGSVSSWRTCLRDHLGSDVTVALLGTAGSLSGRLTWVARDHISVRGNDDERGANREPEEVSVPWPAVRDVRLPGG